SAKSGKYTLEMPSYADGRICCRDIETGACNNLNKNYPLCSDLVDTSKTPDYVAGNEECGIEIEKEKEAPAEAENSCPSTHDNIAPYTDAEGCTVTTSWELKEYPTCWVSTTTKSNCPKKCDNSHSNGDIEQEDCSCGKTTYTWNCSSATNYEWKRTLTTPCTTKPQDETQNCPQGTGTQIRSYTCQNGVWTAGEWMGECAECADDTYTYVADINKCCLKNQPSSYNSSRDAQCWVPSFKWRYHKGIVHAGEALMDAYGSTPADPDATLSAMDFCMKRESTEFPQCNSNQKEGGICYGNRDKCIYGGTKRITERYGVHYVTVECDSLECTYETEWQKLF
ncbi:MAG: hypothetical protein IJ876_01025, partial [Elusimicrobiaceae bacterium]|nr:hypothetical protein [Elusimicrobiaceae bacterium]